MPSEMPKEASICNFFQDAYNLLVYRGGKSMVPVIGQVFLRLKVDGSMKKKLFFEKTLPLYLCGFLLLIMLVTVFTQANNAALTTDEAMHESYGQTTLRWYLTLGRDRSFLNYPPEAFEPQHG